MEERQKTKERLKASELDRYRSFVEGVWDGCFEVDLRGNMTFCNDAACRLFGYPAEQLIGMNNRRYSSPETAKRVYRIFNQVYQTGRPDVIRDYKIQRGDGQLRYLHMTVGLIRDGSGAPIGFRGICRDTTDEKLTETENERLTVLLSQARRLEAIATLAAGVAHNFNNLLMSIQGFVSLMFLDIKEGHRHFIRLKTIEDLIKRGSDLTTQLLGYARHGRFAAEPIDIKEVIHSSSTHFNATQSHIKVDLKLPDTLWPVAADSQQIQGVLRNLFVNAAEAMAEGGTLRIEAENSVLKEHFAALQGLTPGPYVKISVADTGVGMDQATKERIFEPFFSTKDASKGAGLGLASVYGAIKNHGGMIFVDSEKNKGTTFTFVLPAAPEEAQEGFSRAVSASSVRPTILLVDDEQVICDVVGDIISQMGYQAITAGSGEAALDLFRSHRDQIDLVIIDMVMPDMPGYQVIEAIRAMAPEIKAILISGFPESEPVQHAMRDTRQVFLQKPLQTGTLSTAIRLLLEV